MSHFVINITDMFAFDYMIYTYWVPFAICAVGFSIRTYLNIKGDLARRQLHKEYYQPTDSVGNLIVRLLVTVLPVLNIFGAVFGLNIFSKFFKALHQVLNAPLVPDSESYRKARYQKSDASDKKVNDDTLFLL